MRRVVSAGCGGWLEASPALARARLKFANRYIAASTIPHARLQPIAPASTVARVGRAALGDADRSGERQDHDHAEQDFARALERIEHAARGPHASTYFPTTFDSRHHVAAVVLGDDAPCSSMRTFAAGTSSP